MINSLAHLTSVEAPAGVLLYLAGVATGILAVAILRRLRTS